MSKKIAEHRISEEIQDFIIDRRARKLSKGTIGFYEEKLTNFNEWFKYKNITTIEQITPTELRLFLIMLETTHNPGGVHCFWRSIKAFFFWYEEEYGLSDWTNPVRKVAPPKVKITPIPGVSMLDVKALLDVCDTRTFAGSRDQAVLRTLVDTGMRRAEFCNLRIMDLDMANGTISIIGGKGDKDRHVFAGPTARRDISRYMKKRISRNPRDWLWVTVSGTQLAPLGLREIIRRRALQANIPIPSPHDFRRTFAIECLRNGMDLVQLMYLMGHTTTTVLQRYLDVQDNDLMNAHAKSSPVDHDRHR